MPLLCKNCAGTLTFDPQKQMLVCNSCRSAFRAEEIEDSDKELLQEGSEKLREAKVYVCNHCGAEVALNESESSSFCLYCGSPAIVFSRIAKTKCPDLIIPFKITKEEALSALDVYLRKSHRLDKKQKQYNIERIRGIYVPYWKVTGKLFDSYEVMTDIGSSDNRHLVYTSITGTMDLDARPVYGSNMLPEVSLGQMDFFDFGEAVPFDEDYLAGFYSDAADTDFDDIKAKAAKRGDELFKAKTRNRASGSFFKYTAEVPVLELTKTPEYIMVPIWFITIDNGNNTRSTFMMNGQTGQSVGTFPVMFKTFFKRLAVKTGIAALIIFTAALLISMFSPDFLGTYLTIADIAALAVSFEATPILVIVSVFILLIAGYSKNVNKNENMTTEYSSKRRGV